MDLLWEDFTGTVTPFRGVKPAVTLVLSDKDKPRKTGLALSPAWTSLRCREPGRTRQAMRESSCACPRSCLYFCSEVEAHFLGRLPSYVVVSTELDLTRKIQEFHMMRFSFFFSPPVPQTEILPQAVQGNSDHWEPLAVMQINASPPLFIWSYSV